MINLPVGIKITFKRDKTKIATIANNKNIVNYNGKEFSISRLVIILDNESGGNSTHLNGFHYFYYDDKKLWSLRPNQKTFRSKNGQ